jgi:hypothetical protein
MKNNLKFYLLLLVFTQVSCVSHQSKVPEQLELYFKKLYASDTIYVKVSEEQRNFYPIQEPFVLQDSLARESLLMGACSQDKISERLGLLKKIYIWSIHGDTSYLYNLVDKEGNVILDIKTYCCCTAEEVKKIDTINQVAMQDLMESYRRWYAIVKQKGFDETVKLKILPTSFSKYNWVKELEYVSGPKTNEELYNRFMQIKQDTTYFARFTKHGIYEGRTSLETFNEIVILSLLNNQKPFTLYISKFKLSGKTSNIAALVAELANDKNAPNLSEKLKTKGILVVPRY